MGKPYLYGLAAGGAQGVNKAMNILRYSLDEPDSTVPALGTRCSQRPQQIAPINKLTIDNQNAPYSAIKSFNELEYTALYKTPLEFFEFNKNTLHSLLDYSALATID